MNAVVFVVIALTIIPVVISQRLTQDSGLLADGVRLQSRREDCMA